MSINKDLNDKVDEIVHHYNNSQEKYTYYILAVNAACIAFTINLTKDAHLAFSQIPSGLAIICWCISFYNGILQIRCRLNIMDFNIKLIRNHIYNRAEEELERYKQIQEYSKKEDLYVNRLNSFLIVGVVLFIIWHVIRMYNN